MRTKCIEIVPNLPLARGVPVVYPWGGPTKWCVFETGEDSGETAWIASVNDDGQESARRVPSHLFKVDLSDAQGWVYAWRWLIRQDEQAHDALKRQGLTWSAASSDQDLISMAVALRDAVDGPGSGDRLFVYFS